MNRSYKNTVIAILLACILTMAIGYSILNTRLNIKGTSNITSDFNIQVVGIDEFIQEGLAETTEMSFTPTSATYGASIQAPGDGIVYEITIENKGTLPGYVYFDDSTVMGGFNDYGLVFDDSGMIIGVIYSSKIQADKNNPMFNNEITNVTELLPGEKLYAYAYVYFSSSATSLPAQKTFTSTADFNFYSTTEYFPEIVPSLNETLLANNSVVTSGDGLMLNEDGEYVFVSDGINDNVKNYISINDKLMRIVSFDDRPEGTCTHDYYWVIEADDVNNSGVVYSTTADSNGFYNTITPTLFDYMEGNNSLYSVSYISPVGWYYKNRSVFYVENDSLFPHTSYADGSTTIIGIPEVLAASTNENCSMTNLSSGGCKSWLTTNGDTYLFNIVYNSDKTTNIGKISYLNDHKVITVDPQDTNYTNNKAYGIFNVSYGGALQYTNHDTADGSRENPYIIDPDSIRKGTSGLQC